MLSTLCPVPRGLAARLVWLALALYERIKQQAISPPVTGGNMETRGAAPAASHAAPPMRAQGLTHTGKRPRNEDCHLLREDLGLVIVADGFSGAAGGDIAARLAVDRIAGCFGAQEEQTLPELSADDLADGLAVATVRFSIEHAHRRILHEARRTGPPGMSTATCVLVVAGPRVVIGHAGNVRAYRFRSDTLEPLTKDAAQGGAAAYPVGAPHGTARAAIRVDAWRPGDRYLLCTAGLHRVLGTEAIRCTLATCRDVRESAAALVGRALHAGANDNLTAVVVLPISQTS